MNKISQAAAPFAAALLRTIPSHRRRKQFAKLVGPFFEGCVARTVYGFPMVARWHDNANRIGFEGSYGIVAEFIGSMPPDAIYLDIGANQGFTTVLASRALTKGQVLAFEPSATNFAMLERNVAINGCANVTLVNRAVSARQASMRLNESDQGNSGSAFISETGMQVAAAPVRLSDISDQGKRAGIHVKIDTEGFEVEVLKGLQELFDAGIVERLVIEVNDAHLHRFGASSAELYDLLLGYGFQPQIGLRPGHYDDVFTQTRNVQ